MSFMFRPLRTDEIECRIQQVKPNGLILLLYKDARCDQNILDETVGPYNWMRSHSRDNANCIVSIWDDNKQQWISKEDTGTESNTEAQKGLASDSFKRACFNWGIGRELYTSPFIWIKPEFYECKDGKHVYDKFRVKQIEYTDTGTIKMLVIENGTKRKECFWYGVTRPTEYPDRKSAPQPVCEFCGKPVMPGKNRDGNVLSALQVAEQAQIMFGHVLCKSCMRAAADRQTEKIDAQSR